MFVRALYDIKLQYQRKAFQYVRVRQMYMINLKQYCIWGLEKMEPLHTLGSLICSNFPTHRRPAIYLFIAVTNYGVHITAHPYGHLALL